MAVCVGVRYRASPGSFRVSPVAGAPDRDLNASVQDDAYYLAADVQ
jgi:hypothetical protein